MWKKIGAIGPTSNHDNKSNRSKDQNFYDQPFSQMTKQRMSESQIFFQGNDYFFPNHLSKKKDSENVKHSSQQNIQINKLHHVRSCKQMPSQYGQSSIKKNPLNTDQIQELNNQLSSQPSAIQQNKRLTQRIDENSKIVQSTQMISSVTSLQGDMRKLKQCRSTPLINFTPIKSITQEISLDKKIETRKNIQNLKKQHHQIKKVLENELQQFNNEFHSMQQEMKNQISKVILTKSQNNSSTKEKQLQQKLKNKAINYQQIAPQTKKFGEKFKSLNQKKAQLLQKYMSLRVK